MSSELEFEFSKHNTFSDRANHSTVPVRFFQIGKFDLFTTVKSWQKFRPTPDDSSRPPPARRPSEDWQTADRSRFNSTGTATLKLWAAEIPHYNIVERSLCFERLLIVRWCCSGCWNNLWCAKMITSYLWAIAVWINWSFTPINSIVWLLIYLMVYDQLCLWNEFW